MLDLKALAAAVGAKRAVDGGPRRGRAPHRLRRRAASARSGRRPATSPSSTRRRSSSTPSTCRAARRGLDVELAPADLLAATGGRSSPRSPADPPTAAAGQDATATRPSSADASSRSLHGHDADGVAERRPPRRAAPSPRTRARSAGRCVRHRPTRASAPGSARPSARRRHGCGRRRPVPARPRARARSGGPGPAGGVRRRPAGTASTPPASTCADADARPRDRDALLPAGQRRARPR